jgi:hypothetical protein
MGMFDYVRCTAPLPDAEKPGKLYQTKDFDFPNLDNYLIAETGRLIKDNDEPEDMNWHGYLNFHRWDDALKELIEYRAKFTDGQLIEITRVPQS